MYSPDLRLSESHGVTLPWFLKEEELISQGALLTIPPTPELRAISDDQKWFTRHKKNCQFVDSCWKNNRTNPNIQSPTKYSKYSCLELTTSLFTQWHHDSLLCATYSHHDLQPPLLTATITYNHHDLQPPWFPAVSCYKCKQLSISSRANMPYRYGYVACTLYNKTAVCHGAIVQLSDTHM